VLWGRLSKVDNRRHNAEHVRQVMTTANTHKLLLLLLRILVLY
jgi:hypothetical protein